MNTLRRTFLVGALMTLLPMGCANSPVETDADESIVARQIEQLNGCSCESIDQGLTEVRAVPRVADLFIARTTTGEHCLIATTGTGIPSRTRYAESGDPMPYGPDPNDPAASGDPMPYNPRDPNPADPNKTNQ